MGGWKVGVAYERYGYIRVGGNEAKTPEEAVEAAKRKLEVMDDSELDGITAILEETKEIDAEGVLEA